MTTNKNNQPVATFRAGTLKAAIWGNPDKNGKTRYSVNLSRLYTDKEGNWKETHAFSPTELLRVTRLADRAYNQILKLKAQVA